MPKALLKAQVGRGMPGARPALLDEVNYRGKRLRNSDFCPGERGIVASQIRTPA